MHIPVFQKEVLEYLDPKPNENFIDATIGSAGHTLTILEKNGPKGKVLGIDWDPEQIANCQLKIESFKQRIILARGNYADLKEIVSRYKFRPIQGILFDLGMSSWHLEKSGRGFSFQKKEPLDMRYGNQNQLTAEKIVNYWSRLELARILKEYGEERFADNIAQEIVKTRQISQIKNTLQLVEAVRRAVPGNYKRQRIYFATKTFQALRIAVNDELNNLSKALPQALHLLEKGGRLVVISFHSLEDRQVKNFFRERNKEGEIEILTKKPLSPSAAEIKANPRARSAKLRAVKKIII